MILCGRDSPTGAVTETFGRERVALIGLKLQEAVVVGPIQIPNHHCQSPNLLLGHPDKGPSNVNSSQAASISLQPWARVVVVASILIPSNHHGNHPNLEPELEEQDQPLVPAL